MNNLYDILNVKKIDIESTIKNSIAEVTKELKNLGRERTCFIYTSYLYDNLKNKNILCYIVDTKEDMNSEYQHRFIIVPKDENHNYIIDLTIRQFGHNNLFDNLENQGYQLLNKEEFKEYFNFVTVNNKTNLKK